MEDISTAPASPSGDVNCAVPVSAAVRALSRLNSTNTPPTSSSTSTLSKTPTPTTPSKTSRHRHTHSLGLLTPTPSSSSLSAPPSSSSSSLLRLQSQSLSSSSTSLFSLSPSHPYHAQHTPLRSSTSPSTSSSPSRRRPSTSVTPSSPLTSPSQKPRSSPLFQRLLQPFVRSPAPPTTTATATANTNYGSFLDDSNSDSTIFDSSNSQHQNDMAALHQATPPPPHLYQNQTHVRPFSSSSSIPSMVSSSSITLTSEPTSPPSRSERLLRDALMRDGLERNTNSTFTSASGGGSASAATSPFPSPSKHGHKRRHSHIPTSTTSNPPLSPSAGASRRMTLNKTQNPNEGSERREVEEGGDGRRAQRETHGEKKREQYTGSFLFRTAMSSPSAGGVSLSPEPEEASDGSGVASGSGSGRRSGRQVIGGRAYYGGDAEGGSEMAGKYHARSASLSPSPVRRRAGMSASEQQAYAQRQAALQGQFQQQAQVQQQAPKSPLQQQQQPKSPQSSHSPYSPRSQSRDRPSMALPLPMTPHEQVLRARLERVLEVGRVVERNEKERERARSGVRGQEREHGSANSPSASGSGSGSGSRSASGSRDVQDIGSGSGERRGRGGGRGRSSESDRESRDNEVRDEQGGWPWREQGRGSGGAEDGSSASAGSFGLGDAEITSSPVSLSVSSLPKPAGQSSQPGNFSPRQPAQAPTTPSRGAGAGAAFTPTHGRTRSRTGPASPAPGSAMNSPRRSATLFEPARTPTRGSSGAAVASGSVSRIPVRLDSLKLHAKNGASMNDKALATAHGGKIAVPVGGGADGNANGNKNGQQQQGEDEEEDEGELRLLTPPPTPPFTARAFSLSLAGKLPLPSASVAGIGGMGEYCPSPYKLSYPPGIQQTQTRQTTKAGSSSGLNAGEGPRRPANAPVLPLSAVDRGAAGRRSSSCDESSASGGAQTGTQRGGAGYFPASSSSSLSDGSEPHSAGDPPFEGEIDGDGSSASHAITRLQYLQSHQQQPSTRPTFNARKASERCRAIEGYVSFASIEGLGEPPGASFGDEGEGGAVGAGGGGGNNGAGGGLWSGWRRLLGVAGSAATEPGVQAGHQEEGVVL